MSLAEYRKKRDFRATPEPTAAERRAGARRFVVQKHAATRLHFDFRLELGRTLKSWAIPKGLPMAKGEKRLAVQVEDHPLSYRSFEGTIPRGQYGGGTVMVWDHGTFTTEERHPLRALEAGKLHVVLRGEKLRGSWHLVRMRGEANQWLIIRGEALAEVSGDGGAARVGMDRSVLSGRTMIEITEGVERADATPDGATAGQKSAKRAEKAKRTSSAKALRATTQRAGSRSARPGPASKLRFAPVAPMQALLVDQPPSGRWLYEIKFDGYRVVAYKEGADVRLVSRNGIDLTSRFPEVAEALQAVDAERAIIDGELVALDRDGRPSFQRLHRPEGPATDVHFYAFDLLHIDDAALATKSLETRRARLARALEPCADTVRYSATLEGDVDTLLEKASGLGLEGLIGKRAGSQYEPGRRSGAWIKLKLTNEQELVIGGYTEAAGGRPHFGALLLGARDEGALRYVGKVGTGFDRATLEAVYERLAPLERRASPFDDFPAGESAAALAGIHWVQPELVCQVRFTEWTSAGRLRHPVFLGLREDKDARDVVRERPRPSPRAPTRTTTTPKAPKAPKSRRKRR